MRQRRRPIVTVVACVAVIFIGAIIWWPQWQYPPLTDADLRGVTSTEKRIQLEQAQQRLASDTRTALLQAFVGLLILAGAGAAWWQAVISRQGQITERFTRAVDQLGSQNLDVRIGGIYALERIAKDSDHDRNSIQYILGSFVRNHAAWPVGATDGPQHPSESVDEHLPWLRIRAPDVQTAMSILARRPKGADAPELTLPRVDLRSLALREGDRLTDTNFHYSNLARVVLIGVRLDRCDFKAADLRRANLERAILKQAILAGAYLQGAILRRAHLQGANLRGADLRQTDLCGSDLSSAILDDAVLTGARADGTTIWPLEIDAGRRRDLGIIEIAPDS